MKNQKPFVLAVLTAMVFACLQIVAVGQTANDKLANIIAGGSTVRMQVVTSHSGGTLVVSAPDGRVFRQEFGGGASPEFQIIDKQGARLPDGTYTYELRLNLAKAGSARPRDDEPEADRAARKRVEAPAQSGSFAILNGMVIVAGAAEESRQKAQVTTPRRSSVPVSGNTVTRLRNHRAALAPMFDQVIPDDLIVQGSECVGLDCVNNEVFNFDTIRLKENNTRISFNDTSTAAGFPTNDWTIRANSSASGGASFLAFVDRGASESGDETGTIVFEVDAGAPANSVKVDSTGRLGLRTAAPVLDIHTNTSNTPALRFEQNNSGGFTAQTWDVAGNEANFFVRDVTGGSRLPFRIRPGAPTSSIDISASGKVGIGTASPAQILHTKVSSGDSVWRMDTATKAAGVLKLFDATGDVAIQTNLIANAVYLKDNGNVGIGTTAPDLKLSVSGDADKSVGGGSWQFFSDERLKNIKGRFNSGLKAVMQLQPIRFEYKRDNALGLQSEIEQVGFGAQALQKIIPEAVTKNANGYLMVNNDPILWTMLNAIKEQQKEIVELKGQIRKLQSASHRRYTKSRR